MPAIVLLDKIHATLENIRGTGIHVLLGCILRAFRRAHIIVEKGTSITTLNPYPSTQHRRLSTQLFLLKKAVSEMQRADETLDRNMVYAIERIRQDDIFVAYGICDFLLKELCLPSDYDLVSLEAVDLEHMK
jgi:hypothetical protein